MVAAIRLVILVSIGMGIFLFIGEATWAVKHGFYRMFVLRDILDVAALGFLIVKPLASGASTMTLVLGAFQDAPMWIYLVALYGLAFGASSVASRSEEWRLKWELARLSRAS